MKTELATEGRIADDIPKPLDRLSEEELDRKSCIGRVMTYTLSNLTNYFTVNGFQWLLPVALSKSTDPLWPDPSASIDKRIEVDIYGETVRTTSSMIVHKLIASSLAYPKLFILSPNIRIEKAERAKTGKHVYEFTQLDFEARGASSSDIMRLVEGAVTDLVESLKRDRAEDLKLLGRLDALKITKQPFATYDAVEARREVRRRLGGEADHRNQGTRMGHQPTPRVLRLRRLRDRQVGQLRPHDAGLRRGPLRLPKGVRVPQDAGEDGEGERKEGELRPHPEAGEGRQDKANRRRGHRHRAHSELDNGSEPHR